MYEEISRIGFIDNEGTFFTIFDPDFPDEHFCYDLASSVKYYVVCHRDNGFYKETRISKAEAFELVEKLRQNL